MLNNSIEFIEVFYQSPTNIALVKYWGKRNLEYNLPLNSSISLTLNQENLCTKTVIQASKKYKEHKLYLNHKEEKITPRIKQVLENMLCIANDHTFSNDITVSKTEWKDYKIHIYTQNTFPTAAGLASSASGIACLVMTLSALYNIKDFNELSNIARLGSGSACRSLYGGLVEWTKGNLSNGKDSISKQIYNESYWNTIEGFVCIANANQKEISSTYGMNQSVETSRLLHYRSENIVEDHITKVKNAFAAKKFSDLGEIIMRDSNQFHATCLDTFPPIFYLNEISHKLISLVHQYNQYKKSICVAYSFDAGPNAVIFLEKQNRDEFMHLLLYYFPSSHLSNIDYIIGTTNDDFKQSIDVTEFITTCKLTPSTDILRAVYHVKVGPGPIPSIHINEFPELQRTHSDNLQSFKVDESTVIYTSSSSNQH